MSLLTDGMMTERESFILEAADQCGFINTDDDCEFYRGSAKAVVLFAAVMGRAFDPDVVNALIEQERVEWLAAYKALPQQEPPFAGKNSGTRPDHIVQHILTIAHEQGDKAAIVELARYAAGIDNA